MLNNNYILLLSVIINILFALKEFKRQTLWNKYLGRLNALNREWHDLFQVYFKTQVEHSIKNIKTTVSHSRILDRHAARFLMAIEIIPPEVEDSHISAE